MELDYAGRSQPAMPFLGNSQKVDQIYDMARDKSPAARKELMSLICGILQVKVGMRESELVADILIELLRQAEKDLRMALSTRLSTMENVPLRLVLQIANDEIDIARPVLKDSPVLGEFDLMYIIKSKSAQYWQAIAERKNLSALVVDTLADTGDFTTALTILQNSHVTLSGHALLALSDLAQGSDVLSAPLLRREEITQDIVDAMYQFVGESLKEYIREHHCAYKVEMCDAVDESVKAFVIEAEHEDKPALPADPVLAQAKEMMMAGKLNIAVMLEALRLAQLQVFRAQFAVFCGLPLSFVDDAIRQKTGHKLALACKANGINKPDFVSIYLLTAKSRDSGRLADVKDISKAVAYYERADRELALRVIKGVKEDALD